MYLIGIDFGHGETTASYIDTEANEYIAKPLHIKDGNDAESNKVESAICRDKETNEWRFVKDKRDYASPCFTTYFKAPMNEITDENKEAFAAFIKLVYDRIIKNNGFLNDGKKTGKKNFCIYAACPSGWVNNGNENQIDEYKRFMSSIIPIEWIIKESDTAYFKFKAEDDKKDAKDKKFITASSVLVIDIGSSTIDFTAYGDNGLISLSNGQKHGASNVERSIYKWFDTNDGDFKTTPEEQEAQKVFKDAKNAAAEICKANNLKWQNAVMHYIKEVKEDTYTEQIDVFGLDFLSKNIAAQVKGRVFDGFQMPMKKIENDILAPYRQKLLQDFNEVKAQIGTPAIVILTGGASRMTWLQTLVKDVFPEPESTVLRDSNPSYVVSDGIAYYAAAIYKLKGAINSVIDNFWKKFTDDKLKEMIFDEFNISLRNKQLPKIRKICDDFNDGKLTFKVKDFQGTDFAKAEYEGRSCTAVFMPAMIYHNDSIIHDVNGEISHDINVNMNKQLKEAIVGDLKEEFKVALHGFVPDIDLNPKVAIRLDTLSINSEWDIDRIIEMTKSIYEDFFSYGDIFKDRTSEEKRKKFSEPFYEVQEKANVRLPEDILKDAVESLKQTIKTELNVDNMLKKCVFSIY